MMEENSAMITNQHSKEVDALSVRTLHSVTRPVSKNGAVVRPANRTVSENGSIMRPVNRNNSNTDSVEMRSGGG